MLFAASERGWQGQACAGSRRIAFISITPISPMHALLSSKKALLGIAGAILVAVVLVACGGGGGQDAATADSRETAQGSGLGSVIAWTPATITDTANPGSRQDIAVKFTASANVANVSVQVVPALQKLVTVTPASFASLQKGQVATVTLSVAPSATATLGTVQGAVQLRSGGSTLASPLTVAVIVATGAVGLLPPDPGAAGMATVAGVDSNNNGLRDDIERYIWLTYPGSQKKRLGLNQVAMARQEALIAASNNDSASAITATRKSDAAKACLHYIAGLGAASLGNQLSAQELNTQLRWRTFAALEQLTGSLGYKIPKDKKAECVFDPDTLAN
jgi:hypothetical protein